VGLHPLPPLPPPPLPPPPPQVWAPSSALPGSAPAQLCVTAAGRLQLTGAGSKSLWTSSYPVPAAARPPFSALVSDDGCLEVVDDRCQLIYSTHQTQQKNGALAPAASAMRSFPKTQSKGSASRIGSKPAAAAAQKSRVPALQAGSQQLAPALPACKLLAQEQCGGVGLCGADRECPARGCCAGTLGCRRESEWAWQCL
jgi:hypothetical protein